MENRIDGMKALVEERALNYQVMMKIFLDEPELSFIETLKEVQPWNELGALIEDGELTNNIAKVNQYLAAFDPKDDEGFNTLHWDFTKMFIGPMELEAAPWESTYYSEEKLIFQESTLEVRRAFLKHNFLCKGYPNEADDHIGYELDFMYRLCQFTLSAMDEKDYGKAKEILVDQQSFLENHLNRWVPMFAENINLAAKADFYPATVNILKQFLIADVAMVEELIEAMDELKK